MHLTLLFRRCLQESRIATTVRKVASGIVSAELSPPGRFALVFG